MCLPLIAMLIINQEWIFVIEWLNIEYKPWRLFVLTCGSLSLISGLCFMFLPESPKFMFSNGNEQEALDILKKVYRINTGKSADEFKVKELVIENEKNTELNNSKDDSFWQQVWNQTAPLFKKTYLKNTLLLCTIQFLIFINSSG